MKAPAPYRSAVLMSAHGSCPYFAAQVDSIASQMGTNDILVIVDDGSHSVQWSSITEWPNCFLIWTRLKSLGASRSFFDLIENSQLDADCYFLADQDDVWDPAKLNRQLADHAYRTRQSWQLSASAHAWTFMQMGDDDSASARSPAMTFPLERLSQAHFCFETPAPGMTLSFNSACRQLIVLHRDTLRELFDVLPHDRILFALISAHVDIHMLAEPLVRYRQHASNLVGAPTRSTLRTWGKRLAWPVRSWRTVAQGVKLYKAVLTNSSAREASNLAPAPAPDLASMRLRTRPLENHIVHLLLRLRAVIEVFGGR